MAGGSQPATARVASRTDGPPRAPGPAGPWAVAALGGLFVLGALVSLRYSLAAWGPDPDTAVPVALFEGFRAHGWTFFETWRHTPDNWLLSLVPLTSALMAVFGTSPGLVSASGWMIFLASVLLAASLVRGLAGPRAAAALMAVLVFANPSALGLPGFLAAPVSHNVSMLWALLALICAGWAAARGSILAATLAGVCVFIDALSDPWAIPAIGLPLVLAGAAVAVARRGTAAGRASAWTAAAAAIALVLAETRVFHLIHFLPRGQFQLSNPAQALVNLDAAFHDLTAVANIVPRGDPRLAPVRWLDGAALALMVGGAAVLVLVRLRRARTELQMVGLTAILSIAGVCAAFLIGVWPSTQNVGRWFPNLYFLGGLLVALALDFDWGRWTARLRWLVGAYAALFVLAGLFAAPAQWLAPTPNPTGEDARDLAAFLQSQGLSYGYGPYWGAQALTVTWLSGGQVVIRPVAFSGGAVHRREAESSAFWYRPQDEPKTTSDRFLVIRNDGETCPEVEACVAEAVRQFGPPARRLAWRDAVILVWPHSIAARIGA